MLRQCSRRVVTGVLARQAVCAALDSCAPGGAWGGLHTERCCEGRADGTGNLGHAPQACWMSWSPNRGFAAEAAVQQPDTPDVLLRRRVSEANMVLQVCCQRSPGYAVIHISTYESFVVHQFLYSVEW